MEIKIGDKIYHRSQRDITWIVERFLPNDQVECSTLIVSTLEHKRQVFATSSINKKSEGGTGGVMFAYNGTIIGRNHIFNSR